MKCLKKLIAALLVLAVVLSLGVPALAASAKFSSVADRIRGSMGGES